MWSSGPLFSGKAALYNLSRNFAVKVCSWLGNEIETHKCGIFHPHFFGMCPLGNVSKNTLVGGGQTGKTKLQKISTDPSVEFFSSLSGPLLRYKLLRIGPSLELLATMWWTTVAASVVGDQPQPGTHNSPL